MAGSVLLCILPVISLLLTTTIATFIPHISTIPPIAPNHTVSGQFVSTPGSLDAPHLSAINSSVFEWWYFDAVSADLSTALVITFFTTTPNAFPLVGPVPSDVSVFVWVTFPNGTTTEFVAPASEALIASGGFLGDAAAGTWQGANASFTGTPGLDAYEVSFDFTEQYGIKGALLFDSRAPAHLPCTASLTTPNAPLSIIPNIGWTNAIPDAAVSGSFTLAGSGSKAPTTYPLTAASGYHDMNWGTVPFFAAVHSWWWGRAQLGPYSLVWFHGMDTTGKAFSNAYVSENGKVLVSSCDGISAAVTPVMGGKGNAVLEELDVKLQLGGGKVLAFKVKAKTVTVDAPGVYARWLGGVNGGIVGGEKFSGGVSIFERFYPLS